MKGSHNEKNEQLYARGIPIVQRERIEQVGKEEKRKERPANGRSHCAATVRWLSSGVNAVNSLRSHALNFQARQFNPAINCSKRARHVVGESDSLKRHSVVN